MRKAAIKQLVPVTVNVNLVDERGLYVNLLQPASEGELNEFHFKKKEQGS